MSSSFYASKKLAFEVKRENVESYQYASGESPTEVVPVPSTSNFLPSTVSSVKAGDWKPYTYNLTPIGQTGFPIEWKEPTIVIKEQFKNFANPEENARLSSLVRKENYSQVVEGYVSREELGHQPVKKYNVVGNTYSQKPAYSS